MIVDPLNLITEALKELPAKMSSPPALTMLVAIGLQESRFRHRRQWGNGPARGFWQFEAGGGVRGVLEHPSSKTYALAAVAARGLPARSRPVWEALEHDDNLSAVFARLLLWTDPKPLPTNWQDGWLCYTRIWRPGKPHADTWAGFYKDAEGIVNG